MSIDISAITFGINFDDFLYNKNIFGKSLINNPSILCLLIIIWR